MSASPGLKNEAIILDSASLCSKWGFNDGDAPDHFLDWLDDRGLPYPADWHAVLVALVRQYLVPELDQDVVTYTIETNHNPIRAASVDGAMVDDYALDGNPHISPDGVTVSFETVLSVVRAQSTSQSTSATVERGSERAQSTQN